MCYLVAKKFDSHGCLAFKTTYGQSLANLASYLTEETFAKGVQILTVSDPETYGEYKPYVIIEEQSKFVAKVLAM